MKIAVCFKVITDYDQVPQESWKGSGLLRPGTGLSGAGFVKKIFGFFDEGALETGLRIKDRDSSVKLEAISLGKEDRIFTEALYAAGYDTVIYLRGNSDFDPKNTALELSRYLQDGNFDAVLTGETVGPMDSGSVPFFISRNLNCPIVSSVCEADVQKGKLLFVRETEDAYETISFESGNGPMVAVISNAKYPYLRFALYEKKEKAKTLKAKSVPARNGKRNLKLRLPNRKERAVRFIGKEDLRGVIAQSMEDSL